MAIDMDVARIMTRDVIMVAPDATIPAIAALMWRHNISTIPVVEDSRVLGVVGDADLIARESEWDAPLYVPFLDAYFKVPGTGDEKRLKKILATTAADLMTKPAIVVSLGTTLQEVATLMTEERINAVPVVDAQERLVGIVSRADLVRLMAEEELESTEAETAAG